jgi:CheY-like chemotaxis protein
MATIAVFEDQRLIYEIVETVLTRREHRIVAAAASTPEAHALLTRMALGEVQADFTLVDGSLAPNNTKDYAYPPFRFTPPDAVLSAPEPRKWYQRNPKVVTNPVEVVVEHEGREIGADGRFILRVLKACDIETTTINLSVDYAHTWDHDHLIDEEMNKGNITTELLGIIMRVEASKNDS